MNPFDLTAHHSESGSDENAGASPLSTNSGDQDYNHFGPPSYRGEGKKFQCPRCDASFTRPSSLRQHLLIHTGEKPHPCALCPKRFSVVSNLRRHFRSCEGVKSRNRPGNPSNRTSDSPGATIALLPSFEIDMPGEEPTSFNDTAGGGGSPQQRRDVPTQHVFQAVIRDPSSLSPQRPPRPAYKPHPVTERFPSTTPTNVPPVLDPDTQYPPSLARFSNVASLTSSWVIAKEGPLPYIPITMPLPPVCPSSRSFMSPSPNLGMPLHDLQRVGDRDGEMDVFQGGGFGTLGGVGGGGGMGGVGVSGGGASSSSPCTSTLPLTLTHSPPLQVHAEERDSYDTTTPVHPYHPACWKGKLPGPGLMEVDRILEEVAPGYRKS